MEDSSTSWFVFASVLLKCFAVISPPSNVQWQTNLRNFCIPRAIASAIYRSPKNRCTVCLYRRTLLRYSNKLPKSCIALTRACSYGSGVSDRAHHRPQRGCTNQPLRETPRYVSDTERIPNDVPVDERTSFLLATNCVTSPFCAAQVQPSRTTPALVHETHPALATNT